MEVLIVNWILSALFRPISVTCHCFFPELDLSPYPVIQAVIERSHLRSAFRLVMGFDRSLILVPLFDDWRFNRCMGG